MSELSSGLHISDDISSVPAQEHRQCTAKKLARGAEVAPNTARIAYRTPSRPRSVACSHPDSDPCCSSSSLDNLARRAGYVGWLS